MSSALSTNPRDGAGPWPKASPSSVPSFDDHQPRRACSAFRALPHGRVHPRQSNWPLLLAADRRTLTSPSHRLNFPAARHSAERGAFIALLALGCTRLPANPLAHQKTINFLTDVPHLSIVLSKPTSFAGSIIASKRGQIIGNSGQVGAA